MNPNTSLDLFELYNHQAIVESVARWKPDAKAPDGRAKNAMRKTFKNKIKAAGVNGNFDYKTDEVEQKNKIPKLGQLIHMMVIDEEEFNELHPWGKDIDKGLDALLPNIDKALTMAKGVIPKTIFDSSVLGEIGAPSSAKQVPKQNGARTPIPQASHGGTPRPKSELPRPKRNVKKRTYGDSSYEGYGEGYVDDDAPDGGYSTNDDSRKRPKKVCNLLCMQDLMANNREVRSRSSERYLTADQLRPWQHWSLIIAMNDTSPRKAKPLPSIAQTCLYPCN